MKTADTDFQILYPIVMYQNADGSEGEYAKPSATVTLTIQPTEEQIKYGDVNGDGKITTKDAIMIYQYSNQNRDLDERARKAADVNGDGKVTLKDVVIILQFCAQQRTSFPVG